MAPSNSDGPKKRDNINRGQKQTNYLGIAGFVGLRSADPFLQYNILKHGLGSTLIETLGGTTLVPGAPLVTNTLLDGIGLSPYRSVLLAMSAGCMLKHCFWALAIMQEEMHPSSGLLIGTFNAMFNSINSLLFVCSQTSASANGEHLLQAPLLVGSSIFFVGLFIEWLSEVQRSSWKKDPKNKGKVYDGGLFGWSRHINYLGYTMWRSGFALAAGGWLWGATIAAFFSYDFTTRAIPVLQEYLEKRYGEQYKRYEKNVPYKFIPFVW